MELVWLIGILVAILKSAFGALAKEGQFPFQASVIINGCHACSGAIISNRFILTAAHCIEEKRRFKNLTTSDLKINVGTLRVLSRYIIYNVRDIIVHPDFVILDRKPLHDVALLKTRTIIKFNEVVAPIELMKDGIQNSTTKATVIGWTVYRDEADVLLKGLSYRTMKSMKFKSCSRFEFSYAEYILCFKRSYGNQVCFGDPGSPATVDGKLVGIASYMIADCRKEDPDIFMNLSIYYDWIMQTIE